MSVSVYNGFMTLPYLGNVSTEFIYIGPVAAVRDGHAILVNIGSSNPNVIIQPRYMLYNIIHKDASREVSLKQAITFLKSATNIAPQAKKSYDNMLDTMLFQYSEERYLVQACKKIQSAWHVSINNPEYVICNKRLQKEFSELSYL